MAVKRLHTHRGIWVSGPHFSLGSGVETLSLAGTCPFPPKQDRRGPCLPAGRKGHNTKETASPGSPFDILRAVSSVERPRPAGGEIHFALISRTFPSDPRFLSPESEEIPVPPPCGFLTGIYLFYGNWSTETFRKRDSKKWAV